METAKYVKENLESEQRTVRMPVGGAVFEFEEIKQIYEDTQKQRGTGRPRAVVLMVQICTAYPQATVNGSGSRSEHLTQPGRVCCNLVPIVRLWAPRPLRVQIQKPYRREPNPTDRPSISLLATPRSPDRRTPPPIRASVGKGDGLPMTTFDHLE